MLYSHIYATSHHFNYYTVYLIADDVQAYHDIWIIGDSFVKDSSCMLKAMKASSRLSTNQVLANKLRQQIVAPKYFMHQNYNIRAYYPGSGISGANRIISPLIEALNANQRLPQYIILAPDKDLIANFKNSMMHTSIVMGSTIYYIIQQCEMYIKHRRLDLEDKKPGAKIQADYPIFIWIRMVKQPEINSSSHVYSLRGKLNSVLEEQLLNGTSGKH